MSASDRHQLWLEFAKGGGWMCGGQHPTRQAALAAIPAVKADWLDHAESPLAERIQAGSWHVVKRPADQGSAS